MVPTDSAPAVPPACVMLIVFGAGSGLARMPRKLAAEALSARVPRGVRAVATNVIDPRPAADAVNEFRPAAPIVHDPTVATPLALVTCVAPVTEPPPSCTAKTTGTPATPLPVTSFTTIDGGTRTAVPVNCA